MYRATRDKFKKKLNGKETQSQTIKLKETGNSELLHCTNLNIFKGVGVPPWPSPPPFRVLKRPPLDDSNPEYFLCPWYSGAPSQPLGQCSSSMSQQLFCTQSSGLHFHDTLAYFPCTARQPCASVVIVFCLIKSKLKYSDRINQLNVRP